LLLAALIPGGAGMADPIIEAGNPGGPLRFWRTNSDTKFTADRNNAGGFTNPQYTVVDNPANGTASETITINQGPWHFDIGLTSVPQANGKAQVTLSLDGTHDEVHEDHDRGAGDFDLVKRTKTIRMRANPRFNQSYFLAKDSSSHGLHRDKYRVAGHIEASPTSVAIGDMKLKGRHKKRRVITELGPVLALGGKWGAGSDEVALAFDANTGLLSFEGAAITYVTATGEPHRGIDPAYRDDPIAASYVSGAIMIDPFGSSQILESWVSLGDAEGRLGLTGSVDQNIATDIGSGGVQIELVSLNLASESPIETRSFIEKMASAYEFDEDLTGFEADAMEGIGIELEAPHLAEMTQNLTQSASFMPATIRFGGVQLDVPVGDFNHDGFLESSDLDALTQHVRCFAGQCGTTMGGTSFLEWQRGEGNLPPGPEGLRHWEEHYGLKSETDQDRFDVTGDLRADGGYVVDFNDVRRWVEELFGTSMGDVNLDGAVDGLDAAIVQTNLGIPDATWTLGDVDVNGVVDDADLSIVLEHIAFATASITATPEPGTLLLASLGVIVLSTHFGRRSKRDQLPFSLRFQ
jgi:hypothetical protein